MNGPANQPPSSPPECPLGNIRVRWRQGDPLNLALRGHLLFASSPFGALGHGRLTDGDELAAAGRENFALFDGDVVLHSPNVCDVAPAKDPEVAPREGAVTFWLTRLHHERLRDTEVAREATGIVCPKCRLQYFAECDPGHRITMEAAAQLYSACPDHASRVTVPAKRDEASL